ncbi:GCN5-related N-acetyltransferase [mine drainage metagenome]|uniref:GCN5-related N-acetyltransferase n=2 Tax=mine drainage metagenome TaxID=410659 RepID=T1CN09_9ZZZZ
MVDITGRMAGEEGKIKEKLQIKRPPAERWLEYMEIRLLGLETDPLAFTSTLSDEEKYPESLWKERIINEIFAEVDSRIEYRGKGIGDRLLKAGISEISSFGGMRKIKLGVIADQKATIKLYERNGFSWVGKLSEELFLDGEFHDQIIMEKFI